MVCEGTQVPVSCQPVNLTHRRLIAGPRWLAPYLVLSRTINLPTCQTVQSIGTSLALPSPFVRRGGGWRGWTWPTLIQFFLLIFSVVLGADWRIDRGRTDHLSPQRTRLNHPLVHPLWLMAGLVAGEFAGAFEQRGRILPPTGVNPLGTDHLGDGLLQDIHWDAVIGAVEDGELLENQDREILDGDPF